MVNQGRDEKYKFVLVQFCQNLGDNLKDGFSERKKAA